MDILSVTIVFFFGILFGSFLNVVVNRYNTGLTLGGRSFCFTCGRTLSWKDLMPLLSFLALRGKCRFCRSKISWQYPLVEFLSGLTFVAVFWKTFSVYGAYSALFAFDLAVLLSIFWLLLGISAYDLKHKIIPNGLVYAFAGLSLARAVVLYTVSAGGEATLLSVFLAGPMLAAPFAFLWYISAGRWMGFGDAKLALGMGWLLGGYFGAQAAMLAFYLGTLVVLPVALLGRLLHSSALDRKSEIPFAPFLVAATYIVFLLHWDMTEFVLRIMGYDLF